MASKIDQTLHVVGEVIVHKAKTASEAESDVSAASSSSNVVIVKMVNKTTPMLSNY
jgi:hypothetical protein